MQLSRAVVLALCTLAVTAALAGAERRDRDRDRGGRNSNRRGNRGEKKGLRWKKKSLHSQKRFIALYEGEELQLDCRVNGRPKPTISWVKDQDIVEANDRVKLKRFGLTIAKVAPSDGGNYTCQLDNGRDSLQWTFLVEVTRKVWPLKIIGPENITATVGSDVEFRCRSNDDTADFLWKKFIYAEGNIIQKGISLESLPSQPNILWLQNIQREDEGVYACIASNKWGSMQGQGTLTVIDPVGPDIGGNKDMDRGADEGKNEMKSNNREKSMPDGDPMVERTVDPGELDVDFGPHVVTTTRRRGKGRKNNRGGKRNRNRGKNRKNKKKNKPTTPFYFETFPTTALTTLEVMPAVKTTEIQIPYGPYQPTTPKIWDFGKKDESSLDDGMRDTRYNHAPEESMDGERTVVGVERDETFDEGDAANARGNGKNNAKNDGTNAWTIYTVVGAVCGVILLIGLVAVTLTLCCKREEEGVYKSATPV
ncbi:hypothetical protein EGW08_005931 [Elysia chlorotica]|uniref:Ig-like domain-containing protein n=1 Tax=Elysia chlorotica TaxID=188477 RepID=A0A433TXM4_ELYCH|nr:hypothetical protein EGW08_005931 [Elysia chlorotica]